MNDRSSLDAPASHLALDTWDRVSGELQALRRSQEEAYGGVDSALLGKYLAGECDSAERASVEQALQTHPELRLLAELVRDVLGELPLVETFPAETSPVEVAPTPLSSPKRISASEQSASVLPFRPRQRASFAWQRLGTLMAAACLLLVIGAGMGPLSESLGDASGSGASRLGLGTAMASRSSTPALAWNAPVAAAPVLEASADHAEPGAMQRHLPTEEPRLNLFESPPLARLPQRSLTPNAARRAYSLLHQGYQYQRDGQVDKAAHALELAHELCENRFGSQHPQTQVVALNLAQMYGNALTRGEFQGVVRSQSLGKAGPRELVAPQQPLHGKTPPELHGSAAADKGALRSRLERQKTTEVQQRVVPVLVTGLRNAQTLEQRLSLIQALSELGPVAFPAVGILSERLGKSNESSEKQAILSALRRIGPSARLAVPILNQLTQPDSDTSPEVRHQAQQLLAHLSSPAGRVGVQDNLGLFSTAAVREALAHFQSRADRRELFVDVLRPSPFAAGVAKWRLKQLGAQAIVVVIRRHTVEIHPSASLIQEPPLPLQEVKQAIEQHLKNDNPDAALREVYRLAE